MKEIFQGLELELLVSETCFDVEKIFTSGEELIIVIDGSDLQGSAMKGELVISDLHNIYASMKVEIKDCHSENNKTVLICNPITESFNFFKRSFLRLRTSIPVEYTYLKLENEDLIPVTRYKKGVLKDFNPCGSSVEVVRDNVIFFKEYNENPFFINLIFKLIDTKGIEHTLDLVGKVVKVRKAWNVNYLGVLFLVSSFQQYRVMEDYYMHQMQQIKHGADSKRMITKDFQDDLE